MAMVAQVIVDVTAREVDRPFDYVIPESLVEMVQPGVRVQVSFGPRTMMGIVTGVSGCEDPEHLKRLKPVQAVLDVQPSFDDSLLALGEWMRERYVCSLSAALTAMLPAALRTETQTTLHWLEPEMIPPDVTADPDQLDLIERFRQAGSLTLSEVNKRLPGSGRWLKRWIDAGWLAPEHRIKDRLKAKMVSVVRLTSDADRLLTFRQSLRKSATAQIKLCDWLLEAAMSSAADLHSGAASDAEQPENRWLLPELLSASGSSREAVKKCADEGLISITEERQFRDPFAGRDYRQDRPLVLTPLQQAALEPVSEALRQSEEARFFLLQGVTGSGKTEVYLQAIAQCIESGREALMLVPEISLTPQMVERFKRRFGDQVAVLHSRLSGGERLDEWRKIADGMVKVAVGARSALFAPFRRLGLIILDEEHESTYKQEETPRYHAREVAVFRAKYARIPVVFGSATPALESDAWAEGCGMMAAEWQEPLVRLHLGERVMGQPLPPVEIVDMREELKEGHRSMISRRLYAAILDRLEKGEQTVLMLNRRGYATFVMCRTCGHTMQCPHCDVNLTYHQAQQMSRCHYCGYAEPEVKECPSCSSPHIRQFGAGTQKVEEELVRLFPGIRVIRMDVDTTSEKNAHEQLLKAFGEQRADVLLGTQMVAKGLDFPEVTLVGVVSADTMLQVPDFRSSERTFQLLTQVAGRAGRHQKPGEVIVQTYTPDHYAIRFAAEHDVEGFLAQEGAERRKMGYPPYRSVALVTFFHEQPTVVHAVSAEWLDQLKQLVAAEIPQADKSVQIFGPVAPAIARLNNRYRLQGMIKYDHVPHMHHLLRTVMNRMQDSLRKHQVQLGIDMYPYHFG